MVKCAFCEKEVPKGTGMLFVKKDGTTSFYCSSKCEKNSEKLKRHAENLKWTRVFHSAKEKETVQKKEKVVEEKPVEKEETRKKRAERKAKKKAKKEKRKKKAKARKKR